MLAYRSIAEVLMQNLFEVTMKPPESRPSLEMLIHSWNSIDKLVKTALDNAGFTSTCKWEEAFAADLLSPADVTNLTELRMARNRLVHSDTVDAEQIAFWAKRSANPSLTKERAIGGILPSFWPKSTCKLLILGRRS